MTAEAPEHIPVPATRPGAAPGLREATLEDLDAMITRTYRIDEAPQAFADLEAGSNARGVIVF